MAKHSEHGQFNVLDTRYKYNKSVNNLITFVSDNLIFLCCVHKYQKIENPKD